MSLPFRCTRENVIRVCSTLLCAVVISLAMPSAARAWHGDDDDWRPRHHWHYRHHGWEGRWYRSGFAAPPPFGVIVDPGYYYPAPVYRAPCPEHYDYDDEAYYPPGPPAFVPAPPVSVSFGFHWR
jgi:hypothetical protein